MYLTASQMRQVSELLRDGESVRLTVVDGVLLAEVYAEGVLALLELLGPRQDPAHLYLTDFGVPRGPREHWCPTGAPCPECNARSAALTSE